MSKEHWRLMLPGGEITDVVRKSYADKLEAQLAERGEWEPLADGAIVDVGRSERIKVCAAGAILNSKDSHHGDDVDVELPDDIRLCRRVQREDGNESLF